MKHTHLLLSAAGAALLVGMTAFIASSVMAKDEKLSPGKELSPPRCDEAGKLVINVKEEVINTVDSGQGGNYWAFDDLNRQIQVRDNGDGSYCVVLRNEGKFDAQAGQVSPGVGGTLDGDEDGTFRGGYRATIVGTLKGTSAWPTRGSVGTTDYQCTIAGSCPGYVSWVGQYFEPGYSFTYNWWGWIYSAGRHGTWLNASDGNSGDIL